MLEAEEEVRAEADDAVHQMRVATRRLRSALRTFGPLLDADAVRNLEAELKWLAGVLGEVRDREVLRARLDRDVDALPAEQVMGPVAARLDQRLAGEAGAAARSLKATLEGDRYTALVDELAAFVQDPPLGREARRPAYKALRPLVRAEHRRLERRVRRAARVTGSERDAALHRVRKQAKRARYAGEAVRPVFGRQAKKYASAAKQVQDLLGDRQDAAVAGRLLREEGARAGVTEGQNGYTFGVLAGLERSHADHLERELGRYWRRLDRRARRWPG